MFHLLVIPIPGVIVPIFIGRTRFGGIKILNFKEIEWFCYTFVVKLCANKIAESHAYFTFGQ